MALRSTDKTTLERRLEKLASAGVADRSGRYLRSVGPNDLLRRLLSEIDETVMLRRLGIEIDNGRALSLIAANGRLVRIEGGGGAPELIGQDIGGADPSMRTQIRQTFEYSLEGAHGLHIQASDAGGEASTSQSGPSAQTLAEEWGLIRATSESEGAEVVDDFLSSVQSMVSAWYIPGADGGEGAGDDAALTALEQIADSPPRMPEGRSAFVAVRRNPAALNHVVIARCVDASIFLAVPRTSLTRVSDAWRASAWV